MDPPPSSKDLRDVYAIYVNDGNVSLLDDKSGMVRNEGIHYINFGSSIAFCPPPLAGADQASSLSVIFYS